MNLLWVRSWWIGGVFGGMSVRFFVLCKGVWLFPFRSCVALAACRPFYSVYFLGSLRCTFIMLRDVTICARCWWWVVIIGVMKVVGVGVTGGGVLISRL